MSVNVSKKSEKTIPQRLVLLVATGEWFTTLAVEILILRLAVPVVWSSIMLTSIFLGVVLLALSAGYYVGGRWSERLQAAGIINLVIRLLWASALRYRWITFALEQEIMTYLLQLSGSYITTLFAAALLLCFLPIFLASQVIPLLTQLLPGESKWGSAGTLLFVSTIGSFLGSVGTTIFLLPNLGVHVTACIVVGILFVCIALLAVWKSRRLLLWFTWTALIILAWQAVYNAPRLPDSLYHKETAYQEIEIMEYMLDAEWIRVFHTNRSFASGIGIESRKSPFAYIRGMVDAANILQPKRILVVGAAGFTLPYELSKFSFVDQIDVIDIDGEVKHIAETYFLEETLSEKIVFYPRSARYALRELFAQGKSYDMIFLDAYNGKSIPEELTTLEFFSDIRRLQTQRSTVIANMILDKNISSKYANTVLSTRKSVRPLAWITKASDSEGSHLTNTLVSTAKISSWYQASNASWTIATDNKRTTDLDGVAMYWPSEF